jgi:hypothetical protein
VAGGVDAAEHGAQPARIDAATDGRGAQPGREQLRAADHTVLTIRERPDHLVAMRGAFVSHTEHKAPRNANSPPGAARTPSPQCPGRDPWQAHRGSPAAARRHDYR